MKPRPWSDNRDQFSSRSKAAGYAEGAIEFAKGVATYDILPGLYTCLKAGLTILDLDGNLITSKLDLVEIFSAFREDSTHPKRTPFVAAKNPALAEQVIRLLKRSGGSGKPLQVELLGIFI